jgi:hypothetical protein
MGGATLAAAIAGTTGGAGGGAFDFSSGAGSVAIPSTVNGNPVSGVTIEVWGAGGGGGYGTVTNIFGEFAYEPQENPGGGGGGGAYVKTVLALTAPDYGKTILYTVGAAGNGGSFGDAVGGAGGQSVAYAGTYALPEMIATGGFGGYGGIGIYGSQQGAGGTASGGNTSNDNGNGGAPFTQTGAAPRSGVGGLTGGGGGDGGDPVEGGAAGLPGTNGRVRIVFTS